MSEIRSFAAGSLLAAIDTCGPSGSVALGRVEADALTLLGQTELEGRSYSSTLVASLGRLLASSGVELRALAGLVLVNGPGSFTGVRVGVAAAKGLSEAAGLPLVALSRLEALAARAGVASAALDAHRHEVFLRLAGAHGVSELLAGREELAALAPPARIAVCDSSAAALVNAAWPQAELLLCEPPTAADALPIGLERLRADLAIDAALLDGHYLRRSDAEIFGARGSEK